MRSVGAWRHEKVLFEVPIPRPTAFRRQELPTPAPAGRRKPRSPSTDRSKIDQLEFGLVERTCNCVRNGSVDLPPIGYAAVLAAKSKAASWGSCLSSQTESGGRESSSQSTRKVCPLLQRNIYVSTAMGSSTNRVLKSPWLLRVAAGDLGGAANREARNSRCDSGRCNSGRVDLHADTSPASVALHIAAEIVAEQVVAATSCLWIFGNASLNSPRSSSRYLPYPMKASQTVARSRRASA